MAIPNDLFDRYIASGLTKAGLAYIQAVRTMPPARRVGGSRFLSVAERFPSTKMGFTIQGESRTGEHPFVLKLELDDDVIEYYDQPQRVQVTRNRAGRRHISPYTADFLVLRRGYPEVVEVKPLKELEKSRADHPDDWVWRNDQWVNMPVALEFEQLGIAHRIHRLEDIGQVEAANLNLLVPASRLSELPNEAALLKRLGKLVHENAITTVRGVVDDLALEDATPILRWIATRKIFAATSLQLLADPRNARIFDSEQAMRRFIDARKLKQPGGQYLVRDELRASNGGLEDRSAIEALTDKQIAKAVERHKALLPALQGERPVTRNERRLLQRMEASEASGAGVLSGLVPLHHRQGNRVPRITPAQEALMEQAKSRHFSTPARRSMRWVYMGIVWGEVPSVSYKTFRAFIRRTSKSELARKRSGHRSWLASRPPSHPNVRAIWPTTAWELVHIDHTPIDEKVWAQLGAAEVLGRPWLTTMIDGWSNAVLAFWLSFSPPSWESLAMLLRDCVRRHGHLPLAWISDQGPEFGGTFWEMFSANHGCTKFDRAVADARCGSQVERSFNAIHRDLINQLDGNMQNDKDWRSATASHKSEANARFVLARIHSAIESYLFGYYNERPHGNERFSPKQRMEASTSDFGGLLKPVQYDQAFLVETAGRPSRASYLIDSRRGIRVGQRIYWHEELSQPKNEGKKVEVRIEPFDSSILYAHVGGRWIACVSARHAILKSFDEFGRWAQSAIDYYSRPLAAALKRAADERFVAEQLPTWVPSRELASKRDSQTRAMSAPLTEPVEVGDAAESSDQPVTAEASPGFDRLRSLAVEPFQDMAS